jgi:plastocyanin domain-containing protein
VVRGLGQRLILRGSQPATVTFTPQQPGEYPVTCSMNMYRGAAIRVA